MKTNLTLIGGLMAFTIAHGANAADQRFDVDGFDSIDISAGIAAEITTAERFSVTAEADRARTLRRLVIRRSGNTLEIGRKPGWGALSLFRANDQVLVTITMPQLAGVDASSGSAVSFVGAVADKFSVDASSGAAVSIKGIQGDFVELSTSSGSALSVNGTCMTIHADASSGSTISAADLTCDVAEADASSGATVSVFANQSADGDASSGALVQINGNPQTKTTDTSSGGSVTFN